MKLHRIYGFSKGKGTKIRTLNLITIDLPKGCGACRDLTKLPTNPEGPLAADLESFLIRLRSRQIKQVLISLRMQLTLTGKMNARDKEPLDLEPFSSWKSL